MSERSRDRNQGWRTGGSPQVSDSAAVAAEIVTVIVQSRIRSSFLPSLSFHLINVTFTHRARRRAEKRRRSLHDTDLAYTHTEKDAGAVACRNEPRLRVIKSSASREPPRAHRHRHPPHRRQSTRLDHCPRGSQAYRRATREFGPRHHRQ